MDAKERLRRYLEQRRELGESELVLDTMSVDDVLAMLGAKGSESTRAPAAKRSVVAPVDVVAVQPLEGSADAQGSPVTPSSRPNPAVRFDAAQIIDWRSALGDTDTTPGSAAGSEAPPAGSVIPARVDGSRALPHWLAALGLPHGIVVSSDGASDSHASALSSLDQVAESARICTRCALHKTAKHVVPGEGSLTADFVCVGEAPGANEDEQGRPFVGEAGGLLTKILDAIQLQRDDVFICNVLKHRPPMNRDPLPDEVLACQPYLIRQLELIRPRVILALGRFAAQTLLRTTTSLGQLRGQLHSFHGVPLIVTYHPAAVLRNEAWKRPTWNDVKLARRILDASRDASVRTDASH